MIHWLAILPAGHFKPYMYEILKRDRNGGTGETIIFLHIPKAAGTTFNTILDREYGEKATFIIDGDNPGKSIAELDAACRSSPALKSGF